MSRANEEQSDALSSQRHQEGPLQLARSAVHGLNCTLDSIRGRVLRALPKHRYSLPHTKAAPHFGLPVAS